MEDKHTTYKLLLKDRHNIVVDPNMDDEAAKKILYLAIAFGIFKYKSSSKLDDVKFMVTPITK